MYSRVADEIVNNMRFTKRKWQSLHIKIDSDTATGDSPQNISKILLAMIAKKLNLKPGQYKYQNRYGFVFDLKYLVFTV